jgi:hypothetical protein
MKLNQKLLQPFNQPISGKSKIHFTQLEEEALFG